MLPGVCGPSAVPTAAQLPGDVQGQHDRRRYRGEPEADDGTQLVLPKGAVVSGSPV